MVQFTYYLVVLSVAAGGLAACKRDVATVEADIATLVRQVTAFDNAIVAFPPSNGSVDDALAIHADATSIINTLNIAASDVEAAGEFSEAEDTEILSAIETIVPSVLDSLVYIVDKKPAFEALPTGGFPALFVQDLQNLQNASVGFGNALINTAPACPIYDILVADFTVLKNIIAAEFELAITALAPRHRFLFLTAGHSNGQTPEVQPRDCYAFPIHHREYGRYPFLPRSTDDNSQDGMVEAVERLRGGEGYNVVLVVHTDASGLSRAVLRGIKEARGSKFVNTPESVPLSFNAFSERMPFAMGTRYGEGGAVDKDWPMYRRLMSAVARSLAQPLTLTRELYAHSAPVNPVGFKIALEFLLKTRSSWHSLAEVSYSFTKRTLGASKLSNKIIFRYLLHLAALYR
ncbi:hydrophobic surface binding protein A-domain-containing protein [Mycena galopus ATCC 62051]|nr:hydrophobic surface binding protein A-domain-containing protein [Mycena galopus ATCC 62051]